MKKLTNRRQTPSDGNTVSLKSELHDYLLSESMNTLLSTYKLQ